MKIIRMIAEKMAALGRDKNKNWQSILVIDDDKLIIKTVRPILMREGYAVLSAENGQEGIAIARKQKPHLILLDVIMPGLKGREVCEVLKADETTKDIPVIFLTAKDSLDDIQAELQAGGETHLTKPVNPKILVSTVHDVLSSVQKRAAE